MTDQRGEFEMDKQNYLAHFGIIGQKWGVRRYQNDDGTLTDEGRRHYGKALRKSEKKYLECSF